MLREIISRTKHRYYQFRHELSEPSPETHRQYLTILFMIGSIITILFTYFGSLIHSILNHKTPVLPGVYTIAGLLLCFWILFTVRHRIINLINMNLLILIGMAYTLDRLDMVHDMITSLVVWVSLLIAAGVLLGPEYVIIYSGAVFVIVIYAASTICMFSCSETINALTIVCVTIYLFSLSYKSALSQSQKYIQKADMLYENDKRLFSNLAHRLKTPLTILKTELKSEVSASTPTTKSRENLDRIVQDLDISIDELTRVSKINLSQINNARKPLDMVKMTEEIYREAGLLAKHFQDSYAVAREVELNITPQLKAAQMTGNKEQLHEALLNIVDNCFMHNKSQKKLKISISLCEEAGNYIISISDTGAGIPPTKLAQITQQVEDRRATSHIGLEIARNIIELHHGKLQIDSTVRRGTSVKVSLPY